MKTVLHILGQLILFVVFMVLFFGGPLLMLLVLHHDPINAKWFLSHPTPDTTRYFVPTGLILMTSLYFVILLIEAAAKKIRTAGLWTSVVFVVALVIGLVAKFGWVQPS
jgi:hypothetical protein